MRSHLWAAAASLLGAACAPPLSGFQPAHLPAPGHAQVETGLDVAAPTGTIVRTIDAGKALVSAAGQRSLSPDERRRLIEAGANLALEPPALVTHVAVAVGLAPRWELGLRYASGSWRFGGRTQLRRQGDDRAGFDLSVGLGLSRQSYEFPVGNILDYLTLDDLTRTSVDVPLVIGRRASWYRLWGGSRLVLSRFSSALRLNLPATSGTPAEMVVASVDGTAALLALQGGAAIGYAHLFLGFELTVARLFSGARLTAPGQSGSSAGPRDLDADVDLGGVIVSPGFALMGEF